MFSGINKIAFKSFTVLFKSISSIFSDLLPALEYAKTLEIKDSIVSNVASIKLKFSSVALSNVPLLSALIQDTKASMLLRGDFKS